MARPIVRSQTLPTLVVGIMTLCAVACSAVAQGTNCDPPPEPTFTVFLPKLGLPPDEEGQGWDRPPVWEHLPNATDDSITVPNGRPIYALIISGYASNQYLDELMVYNFARHLMAQGAYVHYSWWNNLLAPYMARPLHHTQSHPGDLGANLLDFTSAAAASEKAMPGEDYQLVADAKLFLSAIRQNNPSAMIIVVGHSMGGGATVHLGSQADVVIDILAPIDPVGNRNYPWAGIAPNADDFNWTRWRVSRNNFLGYQSAAWGGIGVGCIPTGPWLKDVNELDNDLLCIATVFYHNAPTVLFGNKIINLHHRFQQEALFPFDYDESYPFAHAPPPNGTTSQAAVPMTPHFCGLGLCDDPGGWPQFGGQAVCCPDGDGVGWANDGHGEIVGYRGPLPNPVPLGVRVRTSPNCGNCPNQTWPARTYSNGAWGNGNSSLRVSLLQALETLPLSMNWAHRPTNANLCLVSSGLIQKYNTMNKPPFADAGGDQTVECTGPDGTQVFLNGTGSSDPENDALEYTWTWDAGSATGPATLATFSKGTHCVTLEVRDPSGHIDRDTITVTVQDTTPPELTVVLNQQLLWPPNHTMRTINANVQAQDLCGDVVDVWLVSVVSSQPDNAPGNGDGNTINDIQGVNANALDLVFKVRAERAAVLGDRHYTVTYRAIDDSDNIAEASIDIIVPKNAASLQYWQQILN